jgi:hypothetical protein
MLGHAVTAKLGKAQKKLKETELKMRLMKQQADEARKNGEDTNTVDVKAHVWDRNELIRNLKSQ